jgi:hypothetical protein
MPFAITGAKEARRIDDLTSVLQDVQLTAEVGQTMQHASLMMIRINRSQII